MKVFISWSGDYSREVAEKLSVWIPSVIQSVDTFYSPNDIGKGENWGNRLSHELEDCSFGIICLTPENVSAPWIHFEAGSLAKFMDSRLSSIMLGVNPSDIKGPLSRFQNTKFEQTDFFKLIQAINDSTEKPLQSTALKKIFDIMWTDLEKEVQPVIKKYGDTPKKGDVQKSDHDAIQEILRIVRGISNGNSSVDIIHNYNSSSIESIIIGITDLGLNPIDVLEIMFPYLHLKITKPLLDFALKLPKPFPYSIDAPNANEVIDALRSAGAKFTILQTNYTRSKST